MLTRSLPVELVFKDGVGFDPTKLIRSVNGLLGMH
jgi:hypothetical protein